ncbi:threonine synthase [Salarchaeum sp. JOR-1]|uniref:threonine synthase n=1 Tax=Salarchaeum sp. JOR-1 TaxID=2599399 RepID=UPI001198BE07|nr:threonine synthase [Salarchaeum sp. JOR-1]QDX40962.1 pyridoxal-phosphate dependent enzyme [Salarchaeum sp. JOR-1]
MSDLVCDACGNTYPDGDRQHCDCGETLWYELATDFAWPETSGSLWAYSDLLPASNPVGIERAAGGTPLVRAPRLDDYAGCRVRVKDESANPTGSFKDRGTAVATAALRERGADAIGTVSHGNMAMSTAAHAASAGMDAVVLVPDGIPEERLGHIARYDPELYAVSGDYGRLYEASFSLSPTFVNSDSPLRVAGQKTTVVELLHQFDGVPDAVVVPVSSGGHASGTWKAVRELDAAGAIESVPELHFAQAAACDPIARAYRNGDETISPIDNSTETVAYSIANADPPSGTRVLRAARDTGGSVRSVDDDAILDAQRALAERAGLAVEAASATSLAAVRELTESGRLDEADDVAVVATGTGFRERPPTPDTVARVTQTALRERLR